MRIMSQRATRGWVEMDSRTLWRTKRPASSACMASIASASREASKLRAAWVSTEATNPSGRLAAKGAKPHSLTGVASHSLRGLMESNLWSPTRKPALPSHLSAFRCSLAFLAKSCRALATPGNFLMKTRLTAGELAAVLRAEVVMNANPTERSRHGLRALPFITALSNQPSIETSRMHNPGQMAAPLSAFTDVVARRFCPVKFQILSPSRSKTLLVCRFSSQSLSILTSETLTGGGTPSNVQHLQRMPTPSGGSAPESTSCTSPTRSPD